MTLTEEEMYVLVKASGVLLAMPGTGKQETALFKFGRLIQERVGIAGFQDCRAQAMKVCADAIEDAEKPRPGHEQWDDGWLNAFKTVNTILWAMRPATGEAKQGPPVDETYPLITYTEGEAHEAFEWLRGIGMSQTQERARYAAIILSEIIDLVQLKKSGARTS